MDTKLQEIAGKARDYLRSQKIPINHRRSLELAARLCGAKDLHHAQALLHRQTPKSESSAPRWIAEMNELPEGSAVLAAAKPIQQGISLHDYAAVAAFNKLADNWNDALRDGYKLSQLANDIDLVCEKLHAIKNSIIKPARCWVVQHEFDDEPTFVTTCEDPANAQECAIALGSDINPEFRIKAARKIASMLNELEAVHHNTPVGVPSGQDPSTTRNARLLGAFCSALAETEDVVDQLLSLPQNKSALSTNTSTAIPDLVRNALISVSPERIIKTLNLDSLRCKEFNYRHDLGGNSLVRHSYVPMTLLEADEDPQFVFSWFTGIPSHRMISLIDDEIYDQEGNAIQLSTEEKSFRNFYKCEKCGTNWDDTWSCGCDDECPTCGISISPLTSEEIVPNLS